MFITTQIEFAHRTGVTVVPYNALAKRDDRQGIFLVDRAAKLAHFLPVETGIVEGGWWRSSSRKTFPVTWSSWAITCSKPRAGHHPVGA